MKLSPPNHSIPTVRNLSPPCSYVYKYYGASSVPTYRLPLKKSPYKALYEAYLSAGSEGDLIYLLSSADVTSGTPPRALRKIGRGGDIPADW